MRLSCTIFEISELFVEGECFLLVLAYQGSPGQKAVKRLCVCVFVESHRF